MISLVGAVSVGECLPFGLAGSAAHWFGGELAAGEARAANGHGLRIEGGSTLILETGHGCDYVTHLCPHVWQRFERVCPRAMSPCWG
jgi:hypothetical protein